MKPTVISANANSSANPASTDAANAITIPINHEFSPHYANAEANASASYGSPRQPHPQQQQQPQAQSHQIPAHFQQGFGFDPDMDMDMDMFPRGRLGRMHHDPFSGFGTSHFGFPQFGSMGRRRMPASATADPMTDDGDFFNRLPNEFRQYIPESFGHRRGGGVQPQQQPHQMPTQQQQQHYPYHGQNYVPGSTPPSSYAGMPPQSPQSKKLCDAAIQTEDSALSQDQVDHAAAAHGAAKPTDSLNQHGLRNTVDMGVKSTSENEQQSPRSQSAPPPEQQMKTNNGIGVGRRATPPQDNQFGTQTSPQANQTYQKVYYPPQQQAHPQQKQQTPPPSSQQQQQQPQTPGGTYIRTIPIFVEGRSEPIINAHKEIPNQNAAPPSNMPHAEAQATARAKGGQNYHQPQHQQHHSQQHRPTPLNTQQHPQGTQQQTADGVPPQTPHTLDSINKIQDIQRDVLELMGKVENFKGRRQDKDYVYLDEMLTRNLLKLDTIDTNGKESIRLARKEAIKCIQASINVLEAKAEENAKTAQGNTDSANDETNDSNESQSNVAATNESQEQMDQGEDATSQNADTASELKSLDAIPLPPPSDMAQDTAEESSPTAASNEAGNAVESSKNNASVTTETK